MADIENLKKRLASSQFGDITGPSESELSDIELEQASDPFYTPERTEEMREAYSHLDPNYAALRRARAGSRGTGATDFGINTLADKASSAKSEHFTGSEMLGGNKGTVSTTDFDPADFRPAMRGTHFGEEAETGPRASRFDTQAPRTFQEGLARRQGLLLLRLAGPSCNHPRCQKIRAKGVELLGTAIGERGMSAEPGVASGEAIPSVRKDVRTPPWRIKEEARSKDRPVMSHGTGKSSDTGDWEIMYGQETVSPKYEPADPKDPRLASLQKEASAQTRGGGRLYLDPSDYLEHHHYPGEEFEPLPWEK